MEVATGTGRHAITAHLHVPEQSFAQDEGRFPIRDEIGQIGRARNRHRLQAAQLNWLILSQRGSRQNKHPTNRRRAGKHSLERSFGNGWVVGFHGAYF